METDIEAAVREHEDFMQAMDENRRLRAALRRIKAYTGKRMEESDGVLLVEIAYVAGQALEFKRD